MLNFCILCEITSHRSTVYDRQILVDLLQNFIHGISRDLCCTIYCLVDSIVLRYHETRDLVTPLIDVRFCVLIKPPI